MRTGEMSHVLTGLRHVVGSLALMALASRSPAQTFSFKEIVAPANMGSFGAISVSNGGERVAGNLAGEIDGVWWWKAAVWSPETGISILGDISSFTSTSVSCISADGRVVVGAAEGNGTHAFMWREGDGLSLLPLSGLSPTWSTANSVSADGSVIVGTMGSSDGTDYRGFRWASNATQAVQSGNWKLINLLAISGDGAAFGGSAIRSSQPGNGAECVLFTNPFAPLDLSFLASRSGELRGIGADAGTAVGNFYEAPHQAWFIRNASFYSLPRLAGDSWNDAFGTSDDGTVIVGRGGGAWLPFGNHALVWNNACTPVRLQDVLSDAGVLPEGWALLDAFAVSRDGTAIVGLGKHDGHDASFIVTGPCFSAPCSIVEPNVASSCRRDDIELIATVRAASLASTQWLWRLPNGAWREVGAGANSSPETGEPLFTVLQIDSRRLVVGDVNGTANVGRRLEFAISASNPCGMSVSVPSQLVVCLADYNCDGFVDFSDFDRFVDDFESGLGDADSNLDGFLDFTDFDAFVLAFEIGC